MKHAPKYVLSIVSLALFAFLFIGSAKQPAKQPPPPRALLKFDYVPLETGEERHDIKFALVNPRFGTEFEEGKYDPYKTFIANMGPDFVEMLSARGFSYIGPFQQYDDMVYNDKKTTDLVLEVDVDLKLGDLPLQVNSKTLYHYTGGSTTEEEYYLDGSMTIGGKINIICSEPFTKTKIWVKNVPLADTTFYLHTFHRYVLPHGLVLVDPEAWNTMTASLEKIYVKALETASRHLEPEELALKKAEAEEIKTNSGFIKN